MAGSQEPKLKKEPAARVIAMEHRGSYDEIGSVYRRLTAWAKTKGVRVAGKGRTIFLDAPSRIIPESARYRVCLPVEGEAAGDAEVRVTELPEQTVYAYEHRGPYGEVPAKYTELLAWVSSRQYEIVGPPFEVYVRRPSAGGMAKPEEYVTEICLPVNA